MAGLKDVRNKISSALFSKLGEQGQLIKKSDGSTSEIQLVKQEKSFNAGGKFLTISSSIKIKSSIKPELYDSIELNDETFKIKASPELVARDIYEVSID